MTRLPLYIENCGLVTALGRGKEANAGRLFAGDSRGVVADKHFVRGREVFVGKVDGPLAPLPTSFACLESRNNRLMQVALFEIQETVQKAVDRYGIDRIAVVMGTSTSGISDGEAALKSRLENGAWPPTFHYRQQEISSLSIFVAQFFGLKGPAYTIATACSSSAKVFASARRLIDAGFADAAIVGGADTLCHMTIGGFDALGLLAPEPCNPFSLNRRGISIGEGASAFVLSRKTSSVQLCGIGETSDAHHVTAPDPSGKGARDAMIAALNDAGLSPEAIDYINLHGTATPLNDAMEAHAVATVFGTKTPCGSTKA